MGCDIHVTVEKRVDSKWTKVDPGMKPCWWCARSDTQGDCHWCQGTGETEKDWYDGRNYPLFGILAGVRECDIVPISEPKGLPADLAPASRPPLDGADHSFSWLTLREILDYDWEQVYTYDKFVDLPNYIIWKHEGMPKSWCGGVSGGRVKIVGHSEMEEAAKDPRNFEDYTETMFYTEVHWTESYRKVAKYFFEDLVSKLVTLGDPGDVRIVFGFDN